MAAARMGHADNLATSVPLQGNLKFADRIFGLFLKFQIAVPEHPKPEM